MDIARFMIYGINLERFDRSGLALNSEFQLNWATTAFNIRNMETFTTADLSLTE